MASKRGFDQYLREQIHKKLSETQDAFIDEDLQDYIMVLVANKKNKSQMKEDLSLFLNESTDEFVDWLHDALLNQTKAPLDKSNDDADNDDQEKLKNNKKSLSATKEIEKVKKIDSKSKKEKDQTKSPDIAVSDNSNSNEKMDADSDGVKENENTEKPKEASINIRSKIVFNSKNISNDNENSNNSDESKSESRSRRIKLKRNFTESFPVNREETRSVVEIPLKQQNDIKTTIVKLNENITTDEEDDDAHVVIDNSVNSINNLTNRKRIVVESDETPPAKRIVRTRITGPEEEAEKSKEIKRLIRFGCPLSDELANKSGSVRLVKETEAVDSKLVITLSGQGGGDEIRETKFEESNEKLEERCKYWPNCKNGDECQYHHPTLLCKMFPNCHFRERCLYVHPDCKFDTLCTKSDCPYTHQNKKMTCKFFPNCTNQNCPFIHPNPKLCNFGKNCSNKMCPFSHAPTTPTAILTASVAKPHQLKWSAKDQISQLSPTPSTSILTSS